MQLGYLGSVADLMKLSGRGADWLAGGCRVLREAEVPHPCGYVRETLRDLAGAHPECGYETRTHHAEPWVRWRANPAAAGARN